MPAEPTNSSLLATAVVFNEQLFPRIESQTEKKVTTPPATSRVVTEEPVVAVKDETPLLGSPDEKPTDDAVVTTARSPTTHFPSVLHVVPSEASGTVHELEPKTPGSEMPDTKGVPETNSTTHPEGDIAAAPTTAPGDVAPTHEEVSEDGSGDPVRTGSFGILSREIALVVCRKGWLAGRPDNLCKQRISLILYIGGGGGLDKKKNKAIETDMMKNMNNLPCTSQQGDFILVKDEDLVPTQNSEVPADTGRNAKAAGASGIMDRKEVLGGT